MPPRHQGQGDGLCDNRAKAQERAERSQTPPSACPFGELDNVVLSPHRGGHGAGIEPARVDALAALLLCAAEGRELPNRVDVGAGY